MNQSQLNGILQQLSDILRAQAWERAKGELRSMLVTYYGEPDRFSRLNELLNGFIQVVEEEGLQE